MKQTMANKTTYIGAGMGLVLFAIFGLVPGSFVGGAVGLNIATAVFGTPITSAILPRLVVAASMLLGIMVTATVAVTGTSLLGWLLGTAVDAARANQGALADSKQ